MNKILLNPGPTNTLEVVKKTQTDFSDVCHRTKEFQDLLENVKKDLLKRFSKHASENDWNISIFGGSGTAAMEALISSLMIKTKVIIAGKYGKRALDIMSVYNIESEPIYCTSTIDLKVDRTNTNLFFVENETTTGEKFCLKQIKDLFPKARLYIDATSSFGATDYTPYLEKIDALSFCSNKCLQSTPGLGIVIWRKSLNTYNKNMYLNLNLYKDNMPFTVPVQAIAALYASLNFSVMEEKDYDKRRDKIINDFEKIGILCANKNPSNSVIGFIHPTKKYEQLRKLLEESGIIIYDGIDGVENSFRISTMSVLFDEKYDKIFNIFLNTVK